MQLSLSIALGKPALTGRLQHLSSLRTQGDMQYSVAVKKEGTTDLPRGAPSSLSMIMQDGKCRAAATQTQNSQHHNFAAFPSQHLENYTIK